MAKIRILLADDFAPVRQVWKLILSTDDRLEIIGECSNGQEVIDQVAHLQPGVVIMDINMSPVNGFEASTWIRQNHPSVRILAISVHNDPNYVKRLLEVGANGFIVKGAQKDEMIKAILQVHSGQNYIPEEFTTLQ